ncbi:MAG: T9SS type A sorting domain-containing protein [Candidatus Eisenbacteria bacterium]
MLAYRTQPWLTRAPRALITLVLVFAARAAGAAPADVSGRLAGQLEGIPASATPSGLLYDRVLPMSSLTEQDGSEDAPRATPSDWRQMYDELYRASLAAPRWPALREVLDRTPHEGGTARLAILDFAYDRLRPDALESGALRIEGDRLVPGTGPITESRRAFALAVMPRSTYRGGAITLGLEAEDWISNDRSAPREVEVDYDDGGGFRPLRVGDAPTLHYTTTGEKSIRLRVHRASGEIEYAAGSFDVRALGTPQPDYTMFITAGISYGGAYATGQAYVYLAEGHAALTKPVIVLEGFDLDNSMNWDELYALLNRQGMLEQLRAEGFDAVVLNYSNAIDYIQRNAFVAVELIEEVRDTAPPGTPIALVGASMGGLVGRYALDYMEANGIPHPIHSFISFDSPQKGANIPLGIQYWLQFFADDSADAAALLAALDSPAARQMLVYHHSDPPGSGGQADPLRAQLLSDFSALGEYPSQPRLVAIANGSGDQDNQGFIPGAQIIQWHYTSFLVDITGDVWAIPSGSAHVIFHGLIDFILLPADEQTVTVSGTKPYDNCPGGWRSSMAQMDATPAPYGDIVALYPSHAFIPTTSALALNTSDLFYNIAGDPNILAQSPFDAVYFPTANQEHVDITAENAVWFLSEIESVASDVPEGGERARLGISAVEPNPIQGDARVRLRLPQAGAVQLDLYDAEGRRVARLADAMLPAGETSINWPARERARLTSGVYFARLVAPGAQTTRKVVLR